MRQNPEYLPVVKLYVPLGSLPIFMFNPTSLVIDFQFVTFNYCLQNSKSQYALSAYNLSCKFVKILESIVSKNSGILLKKV